MTLSIRPVRLNKSVYFRVPSDIVDLIGLENSSHVSLTIEEEADRHLLVYSVLKNQALQETQETEPYPLTHTTPTSTRSQLTPAAR